MKWLDALTTENVQMVRAIEVLDTFRMLLAQLLGQALLVLIFEVKTGPRKNWIFLHHLVQDIDVEGESLSTFQLLDKFAADGASDAVLVVQLLNTVRAQRMAAVDQYARNALAHIVLEGAELADVETAGLIVQVHKIS